MIPEDTDDQLSWFIFKDLVCSWFSCHSVPSPAILKQADQVLLMVEDEDELKQHKYMPESSSSLPPLSCTPCMHQQNGWRPSRPIIDMQKGMHCLSAALAPSTRFGVPSSNFLILCLPIWCCFPWTLSGHRGSVVSINLKCDGGQFKSSILMWMACPIYFGIGWRELKCRLFTDSF